MDTKAHLDPSLADALKHGEHALNVFVKVRTPEPPKDRDAGVRTLVERIAKKTGDSPKFNFRSLDSVLHIKANRDFITELLRQPEIVSASLVPDRGSAMIEPINPHSVSDEAISEPTYPRRHIPKTSRR